MEKKYQTIQEIKEFPSFSKYITFQDIIINTTIETTQQDFKKIEELFNEEDLDELATNCLVLSFLKEMDNGPMIQLIFEMIKKWERFRIALLRSLGCRDITYPYSKLFRTLYNKGAFTFDEIQSEATFIDGFSYMFAKEINDPDFYPEHRKLMQNDWKIFDEVMEYGFAKGTLGYALSHDDIELLEKISREPNFKPDIKIPQSYFNNICKDLLYMACFYGSKRCAKFLINLGAKFDIACLGACISGGDDEMFHEYLDKFPDASFVIHPAVWRRRDEIFDELIKKYPNYVVPIYSCVHICAYKYVYYYMENGVDPNDPRYQPALFEAAENGLLSIVRYIVEKGYPINVRSDQKETALHAAVYYSRKEVVKYLVEHGIDINAYGVGDKELTALDVAKRNEFNGIAKYLEQHGAVSIVDLQKQK